MTLHEYCKCYTFLEKWDAVQELHFGQVLEDHRQPEKLDIYGRRSLRSRRSHRERTAAPMMELIQQLDGETLENGDRLIDSIVKKPRQALTTMRPGRLQPPPLFEDVLRRTGRPAVWPCCWTWTTSSSTTIPAATRSGLRTCVEVVRASDSLIQRRDESAGAAGRVKRGARSTRNTAYLQKVHAAVPNAVCGFFCQYRRRVSQTRNGGARQRADKLCEPERKTSAEDTTATPRPARRRAREPDPPEHPDCG